MYVAAKGGEAAIQESEALFHRLKGAPTRELVKAIEQFLPYLIDRVMGEASLYAPELAALAIAQAGGDLYEAVLLLRAYRSTQPRLAYAVPVTPEKLFTLRRISAYTPSEAFRSPETFLTLMWSLSYPGEDSHASRQRPAV
ncbi:MAG: carbon-phosphorus lyase complex subunit PhnI [Anaerolineae bacterium]